MTLPELWGEILPPLLVLVSTLIGIVIRNAAVVAQARWGIEIEARHREALHSALMTGIAAALARGAGTKEAIAAGISHAGRSVPDALAALQPDDVTLQHLAQAMLRRTTSAATVVRLDGTAAPGITRGTP